MTASRKEGDSPTLKRPLTALLVAPNSLDNGMRPRILAGIKKITIREGHRDYQPGPVILCCPVEPFCVQADITEVKHCRLDEVTEREYVADGYRSQEEMRDDLGKYYPGIKYESPVTVIKWDKVRGKLVDDFKMTMATIRLLNDALAQS